MYYGTLAVWKDFSERIPKERSFYCWNSELILIFYAMRYPDKLRPPARNIGENQHYFRLF